MFLKTLNNAFADLRLFHSPCKAGSNVDERAAGLSRRTANQHRESEEKTYTKHVRAEWGAEWEAEWVGAVAARVKAVIGA